MLATIVWALSIALAGCGSTAPCPTPTAELDSLRTVAEGLESQVDRETAEGRTLEARRDQEVKRAAAAQAALDSLGGAHSH
jgi:outer membrane murein-binding lipoprotein Lpp